MSYADDMRADLQSQLLGFPATRTTLDPIDLVDPADVREIRRRLLAELAEELDQRTEAKRKRGLEATGARQLRQRFYDVADGLEEAAAAVRRHQP